jgi:hypothetical protein
MGASGGAAGLLSLARCPGTTCSSCFGCVGVGAGLTMIALFQAATSPQRKTEKVMKEI